MISYGTGGLIIRAPRSRANISVARSSSGLGELIIWNDHVNERRPQLAATR